MPSDFERQKHAFEESLTRCFGAGDFIGAFYERFIASSDQVQAKFAHTDFAKQKSILKQSLHFMAMAARKQPEGLQHLESIAQTHSKRHLDISPSMYETWLEVLVKTAREFDPEFSDEMATTWQEVLRPGIERMSEIYRFEQTVRPNRA